MVESGQSTGRVLEMRGPKPILDELLIFLIFALFDLGFALTRTAVSALEPVGGKWTP